MPRLKHTSVAHDARPRLKRLKKFAIAEYREELVRDLAGLNEYGQPPVFKPPTREPRDFVTVHIPKVTDTKKIGRAHV